LLSPENHKPVQTPEPTRDPRELSRVSLSRVRIDKWLWAARFFKTRALAAKACELGRIECNGQPIKPSREIRTGDRLRVKNDSGEFQIDVLLLSDMRGPAKVAQTLYLETEDSKKLRAAVAEQRKAMPYLEVLTDGKISKRDRRRWNRTRGKP
jgi:ribosome-associated heat shock protein Hsp15